MAGLSGFVYYHYWFSDIHAPENHLVMDKIHEALLHDEDPNMPLMLSWANEPRSKHWTGLIYFVLKTGQGEEKLPKNSTDNLCVCATSRRNVTFTLHLARHLPTLYAIRPVRWLYAPYPYPPTPYQ